MTEPLQTVWIVDQDEYPDEYCGYRGIYDSLEAAKASCPDAVWKEDTDGSWMAESKSKLWRLRLRIYVDNVQTLTSLQTERAAKEQSDDREQLRREVRKPLPYERDGDRDS